MNTRTSMTRITTLAASTLIIAAMGCQKESPPTANQMSESSGSSRVIMEGETPTDQQKKTMLAAKDALFAKLSGRLMEAMGTQGPASAIAVCQEEATQIAADVSEEYRLRIGRTGVRLRSLHNQPPSWAKTMTDDKTDLPTFVVLDNDDAAALLPIKLQAQCLICHGPKEQIAPAIQDQLARLYPNDEATGFNEGELRGWFWIELPASTL